jgi:hypothetical protein
MVAQVVEALRYKLKGRGFSSRLSHWDFSIDPSIRFYNSCRRLPETKRHSSVYV